MANPLFNLFSNQNQVPPQNNPFGNAMQMMQQFQQFRNGFQGSVSVWENDSGTV